MVHLNVRQKMKTILTLIAFLISNALALDVEEIKALSKEKQSRTGLIEELEIYPEAKEYRVTIYSGPSLDKLGAAIELSATEKVVKGRYIITDGELPNIDKRVTVVVTYEKSSGTFRKWVLLPNDEIIESTGVANFENRTIAWTTIKAYGEPKSIILTTETHSETKSIWKERIIHDGRVVSVSHGEAKIVQSVEQVVTPKSDRAGG